MKMKKIYLVKGNVIAKEMEVMKEEGLMSEETGFFFRELTEVNKRFYDVELNEKGEVIRIQFSNVGDASITVNEEVINFPVRSDRCRNKTMFINKKEEFEPTIQKIYKEKGIKGLEEFYSKGWCMYQSNNPFTIEEDVCYVKNEEGEVVIVVKEEEYSKYKDLRMGIRKLFKEFDQE